VRVRVRVAFQPAAEGGAPLRAGQRVTLRLRR
jgi:hypothetical protein